MALFEKDVISDKILRVMGMGYYSEAIFKDYQWYFRNNYKYIEVHFWKHVLILPQSIKDSNSIANRITKIMNHKHRKTCEKDGRNKNNGT